MPTSVVTTEVLQKLLDDVLAKPDFSFLHRWRPTPSDAYFFPRLNNKPIATEKFTREEKTNLKSQF